MAGHDSSSLMIQRVADVHLIEFLESSLLDPMGVERISRELTDLIDKSGHPKFIIDFANVSHLTSSMLGVLIAANKKIGQMKGELRLAAIPPRLLEVFKLTKLDKLMKIYPNTNAALAKF